MVTTMDKGLQFPFGQPVLPRLPSRASPARLFVLGAYPSALHVRWTPPAPWESICALAVDNEPEPFWNGWGEAELIEKWKSDVRFQPEWGEIQGVGFLNGITGRQLDEFYLHPLGIKREDACITDCLDLYHPSIKGLRRVNDTYVSFATEYELPEARLLKHPSEDDIVNAAIKNHLPRLRAELATARPELVVTLGNAALRVFAMLVELGAGEGPGTRLSPADGSYGKPWPIRLPSGAKATWIPFAYPAAPRMYQDAHKRWVAERSS